MRNAIILIVLALVFFAAGWTIYRFVTKRSEEIKVTVNNAPALQQAPTATPNTTNPAVKSTPTPLPTAVATATPKATTPKVGGTTVAKATATPAAGGKLPTTGPGEVSLVVVSAMGLVGAMAGRRVQLKRGIAAAYRSQGKL